MNGSFLNAYRAFVRQIPDVSQRRTIATRRGGLSTLFIWKSDLSRYEMNSSEFVSRLMAA